MTGIFDSKEHRESEVLAFHAEWTLRNGDLKKARQQYADAAHLEELAAISCPHDMVRVRTILCISAVSLWMKATEYKEMLRASRAFLFDSDSLTISGCIELERLAKLAASELKE